MVDFKLFFKLLNINFTNIFQNLGDVCECATKEGAYCADVIGTTEDGENKYLAIVFEETAPPAWDMIQTTTGPMTEEEFTQLVMETIEDLIDRGALSTENEWDKDWEGDELFDDEDDDSDSFFFYDHEETFEGGLGI